MYHFLRQSFSPNQFEWNPRSWREWVFGLQQTTFCRVYSGLRQNGKGHQGEAACQNLLSRLPTSLRKVWLCRNRESDREAHSKPLVVSGERWRLANPAPTQHVLTSPTKSFTDTLGFDPGPSLIISIGREANAHALIFGKGIEKQRNAQGHVIRGLARIDFSPFPPL